MTGLPPVELPKFSKKPRCPKCGYDAIGTIKDDCHD